MATDTMRVRMRRRRRRLPKRARSGNDVIHLCGQHVWRGVYRLRRVYLGEAANMLVDVLQVQRHVYLGGAANVLVDVFQVYGHVYFSLAARTC